MQLDGVENILDGDSLCKESFQPGFEGEKRKKGGRTFIVARPRSTKCGGRS